MLSRFIRHVFGGKQSSDRLPHRRMVANRPRAGRKMNGVTRLCPPPQRITERLKLGEGSAERGRIACIKGARMVIPRQGNDT
jgi:hypothetical protein